MAQILLQGSLDINVLKGNSAKHTHTDLPVDHQSMKQGKSFSFNLWDFRRFYCASKLGFYKWLLGGAPFAPKKGKFLPTEVQLGDVLSAGVGIFLERG